MALQRVLIQRITVSDGDGIWLAVGSRSGTCGPKEVSDEPLDGVRSYGRTDIRGAGDRARATRPRLFHYARHDDPARVVCGAAGQFVSRQLDARVEHAQDVARREHA